MRTLVRGALASLASIAALITGPARAAELITPDNAIPDRYIVVLHEGQDVQRMDARRRARSGALTRRNTRRDRTGTREQRHRRQAQLDRRGIA
jgi:hypothetical protein